MASYPPSNSGASRSQPSQAQMQQQQRNYAPLPSGQARPSAAQAQAALASSRKRNAADALVSESASAAQRNHKRGRPTSRALPPSVARHVPESALYNDLMRIERSLDWTVARKRAELADSLQKTPKLKRSLRIFLSSTCANQPFQRAGAGDKEGSPSASAVPEEAAAAASGSTDAATAADVPSWTLRIEGRLLEPSFRSRAASSQAASAAAVRTGAQSFGNLVRCVTVELQRDAALYPDSANIVEWHRPTPTVLPDRASAATGSAGHGEPPLLTAAEPALDGFEVRRAGSTPVKARIAIYPAYTPERYALSPELGALLDVREETRAGVIAALWGYVKARNLLDEQDRRHVRCDAALRAIFKTDGIAFHHVPEVINRHLHPAHPVVLEYWIRTDVAKHKHPTAYDIELDLDDWATRKTRERVLESFDATGERANEIAELDDRIAQATASLHTRSLTRDFLSSFAQSPQTHLRSWIASQARDLDVVLGSQAVGGATSAVAGIGDEEMRRAETFKGKWVAEAVIVHESARYAEKLQGLQSTPGLANPGGLLAQGTMTRPNAGAGAAAAAASSAALTPQQLQIAQQQAALAQQMQMQQQQQRMQQQQQQQQGMMR